MRILLSLFLLLFSLPSALAIAQGQPAAALKPTCEDSLQAQIDAAAPWATLSVRSDCIYRERVTILKPLVLDGQDAAEIRGSDIWVDWLAVDGGWQSALSLPEWYSHGSCAGDTEQCLWPEQVFLDGVPLRQVTPDVAPGSGQFALTSDRHVLIADDPSTRVVEVTMRRQWVRVESDDVVIRGFSMRHASNDAQDGALRIEGAARWAVEGNTLAHAHGALVHFDDTEGGRLAGNDLSYGGQQGFSGSGSGNVISGNVVHHNNTEGFSTGWEAGGAKVTRATDLLVEGNEVAWNDGPGFWCDVECRNVRITANSVHHNAGIGIFFEISDGAEISDNRVWENARQPGAGWVMQAGILIASSSNADVHDNVVAWNGDGIAVVSQCRARLYDEETCDTDADVNRVSGNRVHNNTIVMTSPPDGELAFALGWVRDIHGQDGEPFDFMFSPGAANGGRENRYWIPGPIGESGVVFAWGNENLRDLAAFISTPGEENAFVLTEEERDRVLIDAGIPTGPEPIDAGI